MATLSNALARLPAPPNAGSNRNSTILHSAPPHHSPDKQFSAHSHASLDSTPYHTIAQGQTLSSHSHQPHDSTPYHTTAQGQTLSSHSHQPHAIQAPVPFPQTAVITPAHEHPPGATLSFPNPHATSQTLANPEPARADRQASPSVDTMLNDIMGDLSEAQQASSSKHAPALSTWEGRQVCSANRVACPRAGSLLACSESLNHEP